MSYQLTKVSDTEWIYGLFTLKVNEHSSLPETHIAGFFTRHPKIGFMAFGKNFQEIVATIDSQMGYMEKTYPKQMGVA